MDFTKQDQATLDNSENRDTEPFRALCRFILNDLRFNDLETISKLVLSDDCIQAITDGGPGWLKENLIGYWFLSKPKRGRSSVHNELDRWFKSLNAWCYEAHRNEEKGISFIVSLHYSFRQYVLDEGKLVPEKEGESFTNYLVEGEPITPLEAVYRVATRGGQDDVKTLDFGREGA